MAANQPQFAIDVDAEEQRKITAYKAQLIKPSSRVTREFKEWLFKFTLHDPEAVQWSAIMKFLPNATFLNAYTTAEDNETIGSLNMRQCLCELARLYLTIRSYYHCAEAVVEPMTTEQFIAALIVVQGKHNGVKIGIPAFHLNLDNPANVAYGGLHRPEILKLWNSDKKECILIVAQGMRHQSLAVVDLRCNAIIHLDSWHNADDKRSTFVFKHIRDIFRDSGYPQAFEELTPTVTKQDNTSLRFSGPCVILMAHAWAQCRQHGVDYWGRSRAEDPGLQFTDWNFHAALRGITFRAQTTKFEVARKMLEDGYSALLGYIPLLYPCETGDPIPLSARGQQNLAGQGGQPDLIVIEDD